MIRLSIITPTYNAHATVADTLDSVASQQACCLEHLVVDGRSTDRTLEIVEAKRRPFTRVISEKDDGLYDAINKGIRRASGDVIGLIHADDVYPHPRVLASVSEVFEKQDVECCYGDHEYVSATDTRRVIRYWKAHAYRRGLFRRGWMPPHPTFYVRRDVYQRLGLYDISFAIAADYELMLRYFHVHEVSVAYIPRVLMKMRVGGMSNRSLGNIRRKTVEDLRAWRKNGLPGGVLAVLLKNFTKLPQFVARQRSVEQPDLSTACSIWRPDGIGPKEREAWFAPQASGAEPLAPDLREQQPLREGRRKAA